MIQKYFKLDKNYILEQAQMDSEPELVTYLIDFVKQSYLDQCNPLGIIDEPIQKILIHKTRYSVLLEEFYRNLAAVYRYRHGENQLELLFDGQDHYQKYKDDWEMTFLKWLVEFSLKPNFLKAVLELTVFYPEGRSAQLAEGRMKNFINQHFELKIYKYRGIVQAKLA